MNTNIEVLLELNELVEAARLLGVTQAKRGFGCHTDEDSRFERAMYESIDKHRAALLDERDQLAADLEAAREDVSIARRALLWLTGGDSGMSSKAICCHMLGMNSDGIFPLDPSDLGRCLRLLERFPEWKPRMGEMARYSAQWAALVERWDELAEMMADEVGIDWSKGGRAPRTYAAMKDAMLKAREVSND